MGGEQISEADPRIQSALAELRGMIQDRWPRATFEVTRGEDPEGVYLGVTVDVEDSDEVMDLIMERLLESQVEKGLPVYVIPMRPLERVVKELQSPRRKVRPGAFLEGLPPA